MPEQNSQNVKAFDPASFTMPARPSQTYSVIAKSTEPELSSYVQTVFLRPSGSITHGARLSDQSPSAHNTAQNMRTQRQSPQAYRFAQPHDSAPQPPTPQVTNGVANNRQASVQFNLRDQTVDGAEAYSHRPIQNQNQSFAPPVDRSNLPYVPRTDVAAARQADSSAAVLAGSGKKFEQAGNQNSIAKETQAVTSKTKLVDLRRGSHPAETPQRDQNTIAKKPAEFLKREAFSNKFKVTRSEQREPQGVRSSGKIIYLKSAPPADHSAQLKTPKLAPQGVLKPLEEPAVNEAEPGVVSAEPAQIQPPQPQIIQWPIVDSVQEQVLFPAPVVTASPVPMEIEFVSTSPSTDAETTQIDFAEVNMKVSAESATDQTAEPAFNPFQTEESAAQAESSFDPFQTTKASEDLNQESPFQSSTDQPSPFDSPQEPTMPVKSSPFQSTPEEASPFQTPSPFESVPVESPFESSLPESSPFEPAPDDSSPFRSTLFQSPSSPLENANQAQLSSAQENVSETDSQSFAEPEEDFSPPAAPVTNVSLNAGSEGDVSKLDTTPAKQAATSETSSTRHDFRVATSDASSSAQENPFRVIGHRRVDFAKDAASIASKFDSNAAQTADDQNAEIALPVFKPSVTVDNAHQQFMATTLQSGHRSEARSEQQFETPWLSPWWMLVGLIPIALYVGTVKLFKDEDEYHSHKTELFGRHLEFDSDFGEIGRSKSDATYGRQDTVPTVRGPSGETVRLDVAPVQSPIEFAESLQFELPTAKEVGQSAFGPELRLDQSPNFFQSNKTKTVQPQPGRKKKNQRNANKKRSKR